MLGAWFMATDYVTSPITKKGQYVYGALLVLTGLFRLSLAALRRRILAIIVLTFCTVELKGYSSNHLIKGGEK